MINPTEFKLEPKLLALSDNTLVINLAETIQSGEIRELIKTNTELSVNFTNSANTLRTDSDNLKSTEKVIILCRIGKNRQDVLSRIKTYMPKSDRSNRNINISKGVNIWILNY